MFVQGEVKKTLPLCGDATQMRRRIGRFGLSALALAFLLLPGFLGAQVEERRAPFLVTRATSEVTIDGVIEEKAWEEALTLELKYEVSPGENTEPPVRTVAFVTFDDNNVLVAFRCFDPEPEKIRARYRDRDQIFGEDSVGVALDTFNDERRAYEFWVNPLGAQMDAILNDLQRGPGGKGFDRAWDAIWESAGRLTDFGYEVELAVPFNQIRFQSTGGAQTWGIDLTRTWPRKDRVRIGLFPRERGANSYLAQADKITGFEGVSPGRNIELVPTLTGFVTEERPDFPDSLEMEEDKSLEAGVTARWGITPNITLIGAINPDFSQVEADAIQIAINQRFALFFPEKRPFFLESNDYFTTGLPLLYTRMISDPLGALKATGKLGRHTFGVFSARDEATNLIVPGVQESESASFESPNTSTVARYRYDLGSDSTIGAMFTDREGEDGYFNRVASMDAKIRPSESDSISFDAAWSNTRYSQEMQDEFGLDSDEISSHALSLRYHHSKRNWFAFADYSDFGDDFRADLGFIPRVGYREGSLGAGYLWWGEENNWYNRLELGGFLNRITDQEGGLLSDLKQIWFQGNGPLQSNFHLELGNNTEVYEGVRFDNMVVPSFRIHMRPTAWLRIRAGGVFGDWVDFSNVQAADRVRLDMEFGFDFGRHLQFELSHLYSTLDVEGGRLFTANVPQLMSLWQFNTRTFVRAIIQYTDISRDQDLYEDEVDVLDRDFFVQLLFSYKVNPQTVFFLGYSEGGAENQDISMIETSRTVFVKIGYAWLW